MNGNKCPICHSYIGTWTQDPILTPKGLAGNDYKGTTKIDLKLIRELQEDRWEKEGEVGIPEDQRTQFTELYADTKFIPKSVINELRASTEKILAYGGTVSSDERENLLREYFNYDKKGEYIGTYEYGEKLEDKKEWKVIDTSNKPNLPEDNTFIKASIIEELRHPILGMWKETFDRRTNIEQYPFLDLNGVRTGLWSFYWANNYRYITRIPYFYGDNLWQQVGGFIYPGVMISRTYDLNKTGSISYNLTQSNSKLHCASTTTTLYPSGNQCLWYALGTYVNSYFSPLSRLIFEDLTFDGEYCDCLITVSTVLSLKTLTSLDPVTYSETTKNVNLHFYTVRGDFRQPDAGGQSPYIKLFEDYMLYAVYRNNFYREYITNCYTVSDINEGFLNAINYEWNTDYRPYGESQVLGQEYVSKIYVGRIGIFLRSNADGIYNYQTGTYTLHQGWLDFSLDTVKITSKLDT